MRSVGGWSRESRGGVWGLPALRRQPHPSRPPGQLAAPPGHPGHPGEMNPLLPSDRAHRRVDLGQAAPGGLIHGPSGSGLTESGAPGWARSPAESQGPLGSLWQPLASPHLPEAPGPSQQPTPSFLACRVQRLPFPPGTTSLSSLGGLPLPRPPVNVKAQPCPCRAPMQAPGRGPSWKPTPQTP